MSLKSINQNYNLLLFTQLIIMIIGIVWLSLNKIESGVTYVTILFAAMAIINLILLFIKEDAKDSVLKYIKIPFFQNNSAAGIMYFVGLLIPILLFSVVNFNSSQYIVPLAAGSINSDIDLSFQQLSLQEDPFFKFFITVFTAGSLEEFAFGFVLVLTGAIITMMFVGKNKPINLGESINKHLYALGGFVFSTLLFIGAHKLNNSYVLISMFVIAALFRIVLNSSIYYVGLGLIFTIGFHQANNLVYLVNIHGWSWIGQALLSPGGLIIIVYLIWVLGIVIYGLKDGIKGLKSETKSGRIFNI